LDNINLIRKTFEAQIGQKVCLVQKYENVANNSVYRIETDSQPYIFKVYNNKNWPEDGKLSFINQKLNEYKIPHAEILVFNRNDDNFPNGFLIEECLPGTTADRLALSTYETLKLFEKLAVLVSQVHTIKLTNYGYTGNGMPAMWATFSEFMFDCLDESTNLTAHNLVAPYELDNIRQEIGKRLKVCDKYPSVLCHGDLSAKNVLVHSNDVTLIDWDDAHSLCWMADIARLTLWMKLEYGDDAAGIYRKVFLDNYETEYGKKTFYELEDTLHVWYGIDYLGFFVGKPEYENMKTILRKSLNCCGMKVLKCL